MTDGGSGIGRAVALSLIEAGAFVTIADMNEAAAASVIAEAAELPGKAHACRADVANEADVAVMSKALSPHSAG